MYLQGICIVPILTFGCNSNMLVETFVSRVFGWLLLATVGLLMADIEEGLATDNVVAVVVFAESCSACFSVFICTVLLLFWWLKLLLLLCVVDVIVVLGIVVSIVVVVTAVFAMLVVAEIFGGAVVVAAFLLDVLILFVVIVVATASVVVGAANVVVAAATVDPVGVGGNVVGAARSSCKLPVLVVLNAAPANGRDQKKQRHIIIHNKYIYL